MTFPKVLSLVMASAGVLLVYAFQINGTDLLLRDLNIFATTNANHRAILEQWFILD